MGREKIYGISLCRLLAVVLIVACHILQQGDNPLCQAFNIGVPMFLFLSGYLYGGKGVGSPLGFWAARARRILIPYYLLLAVTVAADWSVGVAVGGKELLVSLLCGQMFFDGVPMSGHLWFVTCILLCYLITPLLQKLRTRLAGGTMPVKAVAFAAVALAGTAVIYLTVGGYTLYIGAYMLGYFLAALRVAECKWYRAVRWPLAVLAVLAFAAYVVLFGDRQFNQIVPMSVKTAAAAVFCLCFAEQQLHGMRLRSLLDISDRYSYYIYLGHHLFILGAWSLLAWTPFRAANIAAALLAVAALSFTLEWVTQRIEARLFSASRQTHK